MSHRVSAVRLGASHLAVVAAALSLLAIACGGTSQTTLILEPDPETVAEGTTLDSALDDAVGILQQRLSQFGAEDVMIDANGGQITVSLSGVDAEVARALLLPQGILEFRQPAVSDIGFVICTDEDGEQFEVLPLRVNPDSASRNPARCFGDNRLGDPQWEPTPTVRVRSEEMSLADLVEPGSWEIRNETALAPHFTEDGADLLKDVTADEIGYPLGLFVDGELIGAPRIQRAITNGNPVISGFTATEARIRQAQLNAGPLPFGLIESISG